MPLGAMPLGATALPSGVNFAVYSRHATLCTLVLFEPAEATPFAEIPFPPEFRIGDVHAMTVFNLDPEEFEYGYRMEGPMDPAQGHYFDHQNVLLDPAARSVVWRSTWGRRDENLSSPRGQLIANDFDWENDRPLGLPLQDLVIYEMHVRGFTRHPSSGVRFPGTYAGVRERIPYLRDLGVNCVELLPIFEFDEAEVDRHNPITGEKLFNYWGYSTLGFNAPKAGYAATGPCRLQTDEFKTLVKELHRSGIEVILDVVFNHTSEGNENGPSLSFRGLDNKSYYMLTPEGYYYNFSGCGNTLNCNHPVVRDYVLNCLRYWVSEYHIDGFRFDLASILGRASNGTPLANPPLLESLALDPVLGRTKLIAEAWDAGGLYQVGHFPAYGRWAEWNGKYRDSARKFLKGDEVGRTQGGNNNTYCQDNELSWFDWNQVQTNAELLRFCRSMIAFRKAHPTIRHGRFAGAGPSESGSLEISWHGTEPYRADWPGTSRVLAFHTRLRREPPDDVVYAALNMYWDALPFGLPDLEVGRRWHLFANTGMQASNDVYDLGSEPEAEDQNQILVGGRSVMILVVR